VPIALHISVDAGNPYMNRQLHGPDGQRCRDLMQAAERYKPASMGLVVVHKCLKKQADSESTL